MSSLSQSVGSVILEQLLLVVGGPHLGHVHRPLLDIIVSCAGDGLQDQTCHEVEASLRQVDWVVLPEGLGILQILGAAGQDSRLAVIVFVDVDAVLQVGAAATVEVTRERGNDDCGELGWVPRMCWIQILQFYAVPLICYVYLKMASIEVKQNSCWAPVRMLN